MSYRMVPEVSRVGAMRIFVLTPGRSGSVTFAMACGHMSNFSSGHESRAALTGSDRLEFPDDHIEVDNRLSWFTGPLSERYPDAGYVHLTRDPEATARSYLSRWRVHPPPRAQPGLAARARRRWETRHPGPNLMAVFGNGILMRSQPWPEADRADVSRFLVDTIHSNIRTFLEDRPHIDVALETGREDFDRFWDWIGAEGDRDAALEEWTNRHNATRTNTR